MVGLFHQINAQGGILRTALQGLSLRNEVIVNNIANNDVPGFRAKRVDFEDALSQAVGDYPRIRHLGVDVSGVTPRVSLRDPDAFYRIDGNNVDIEAEMAYLYQNMMRFDTMISSIIANSSRVRSVLQMGR